MPYKRRLELPNNVRSNLPLHAQDIYRKAYNDAWERYDEPSKRKGDADREEVSHRVAWSAVKKAYEKKKSGEWHEK